MGKLKFDKKGFLILQKLNLEIKHDDRTKDLIDNVKKEKLKGEIENLKNLINKNDGINRASRLTVNIKI